MIPVIVEWHSHVGEEWPDLCFRSVWHNWESLFLFQCWNSPTLKRQRSSVSPSNPTTSQSWQKWSAFGWLVWRWWAVRPRTTAALTGCSSTCLPSSAPTRKRGSRFCRTTTRAEPSSSGRRPQLQGKETRRSTSCWRGKVGHSHGFREKDREGMIAYAFQWWSFVCCICRWWFSDCSFVTLCWWSFVRSLCAFFWWSFVSLHFADDRLFVDCIPVMIVRSSVAFHWWLFVGVRSFFRCIQLTIICMFLRSLHSTCDRSFFRCIPLMIVCSFFRSLHSTSNHFLFFRSLHSTDYRLYVRSFVRCIPLMIIGSFVRCIPLMIISSSFVAFCWSFVRYRRRHRCRASRFPFPERFRVLGCGFHGARSANVRRRTALGHSLHRFGGRLPPRAPGGVHSPDDVTLQRSNPGHQDVSCCHYRNQRWP